MAGKPRSFDFVSNPCSLCTLDALPGAHGLQLGDASKSYASATLAAGRVAVTWFSPAPLFTTPFSAATDRVYTFQPDESCVYIYIRLCLCVCVCIYV